MKDILLTICYLLLFSVFAFSQDSSVDCAFPTISEPTGGGMYCPGDDVTLEITGDLGDATEWQWYTGSCGGEVVAGAKGTSITFKAEKTASYFIRGVSGCVATAADCSDEIKVVVDDEPPVITCPADIEVKNDEGKCGAEVTYTLPTAKDNCAEDKNISIKLVDEKYTSGSFFPVGTTEVFYVATDDQGNKSKCSFSVTVIDAEPPVITLANNKTSKWPPNHKPFKIEIKDCIKSVRDNCEVSIDDIVIEDVSSDEAQNGSGDGNTENDIVISDDCKTVHLLAERQGGGNGRVYTIKLAVPDIHGNIGYADIKAEIRHDNGKNSSVIDDGPVYVVNGCDLDGDDAEIQPIEESANAKSADYQIETYPNPANKSLKVKLFPEYDDHVSIDIYNLEGRKIRHLFDGKLKQGRRYSWTFDIDYIHDRIFLLMIQGEKMHRLRKIVKDE